MTITTHFIDTKEAERFDNSAMPLLIHEFRLLCHISIMQSPWPVLKSNVSSLLDGHFDNETSTGFDLL